MREREYPIKRNQYVPHAQTYQIDPVLWGTGCKPFGGPTGYGGLNFFGFDKDGGA